MIIYENLERIFSGKSYDITYSDNLDRFSHKVTFDALEEIVNKLILLNPSLSYLDLGCGQGQVLAKIYELVKQRLLGKVESSKFYGIDFSKVAIEQCEQKYPEFSWVIDSFQDFLTQEDKLEEFQGKFNLILNKGGITHVNSQEEYQQMLQGINRLLAKGGTYVLIKNNKFYQKWSNAICSNWLHDIFDIALETFGNCEVMPDSGYYIKIYQKKPAKNVDAVPKENYNLMDKPVSLTFLMNDGTTRKSYISGDELMYTRLLCLLNREDNHQPFVYEIPQRYNEKRKKRTKEIINYTLQYFNPNQKNILLLSDPVRLEDGRSFEYIPLLLSKLENQTNFIYFPKSCKSISKYCDFVNDWLATKADLFLLGCGLEDYKLDPETNKPLIDLDEFRYRLDWVFEKIIKEHKKKILWISSFQEVQSSELTKLYADAVSEICQIYKVPILDLSAVLNQKKLLKKNSCQIISDLISEQIQSLIL